MGPFETGTSSIDQSSIKGSQKSSGREELSPAKEWDLIKRGFWSQYYNARGSHDEPTYLGFKIIFMFNSDNSPLFNLNENAMQSAYSYLKNVVGDSARADAVKIMKEEFEFVSKRSPWYFQSVEGLNQAMSFDPTTPYRGDEHILTINTLEALDLRIHSLMNLYSYVSTSRDYWKEILPYNLRKFSMWIFVNEIRDIVSAGDEIMKNKFDHQAQLKGSGYSEEEASFYANSIANNSSEIIFKFSDCEFVIKDYGEFMSTVSNGESSFTPITNKIKINYNNVEIQNQFYWLGGVKENPYTGAVPPLKRQGDSKGGYERGFLEQQKRGAQTFVNQTREQARNLPERARALGIGFVENFIATNFLNPLLLGNVYNFSPTQVTNLAALNTLPRF